MKTTYHSNLGISDSSQVGNASSKEETCFKIFFYALTCWLQSYKLVCRDPWSLWTWDLVSWPPSHTSRQQSCGHDVSVCLTLLAPRAFWGQLISSICHKPGRELAPCCSWDTRAWSHVLPLEARVSALENSESTNMDSDWHSGYHCRVSSPSESTELFQSIIYLDTVMKKYIVQTFALIPGYWVLSILFVLLQGRY